jgi:hypothetical protein
MSGTRALSLAAAAAAAVAVFLCAHFSDVSDREVALERFLLDEAAGIGRIVTQYGVDPRRCGSHSDDFHSLGMAFVTVESFATSRSESWVRTLAAHIAIITGFAPDISLGPGRIRVSTATAMLRNSNSKTMDVSTPMLIEELLTRCGSALIAARLVQHIAISSPMASRKVDLKFIRFAARTYNGQKSLVSPEAMLSAELYLRLLYAAYQHYRFSLITEDDALRSQTSRTNLFDIVE